MNSDIRKYIKGVSSGYIYMFVSIGISLWLVPFVLKYLSKSEYGIFAIASDLLGWLAITNLGITAAFNSKGAQLMATKDSTELNIVASTTFFAQMISAGLIILVGIVVTLNPDLVFVDSSEIQDLQIVVAILVAGFYISYITQPLSSLLIADKQIHIDNYLKFGLLIFRTSLTVILLMNGFKLLSLAISSFTANVVIAIITWIRVKKTLPEVKIQWQYWKIDRLRFLLRMGIWFTIGGLAGILIMRMDAFLIGKYISLSIVTYFVINNRIYLLALRFHNLFFNISRPYFAQTYGRGEIDKLAQMYNLIYYCSFATAFILGIGVFSISKWFIGWWVGSDFYLGHTINLLLCINFIVQAVVLPNRILLATTFYKIELHNLTRISEGLLKFTLSIIFLKQYGISALVVAGIMASLFFSNIGLSLFVSQLLKESFLEKLVPFLFVACIPLIGFTLEGNYLLVAYVGISVVLFLFVLNKFGGPGKIHFAIVKIRNGFIQ